jgi:hypothetical protein
MTQTQKMYLGGVPVIKNYFGEDPIVSAAATISFPYEVEYLVYAAGGRGGNASGGASGGGGGAGGLLSGSATINPFEVYQVKVGAAANGNGEDSYFTGSNLYLYTFGGGQGGGPDFDSGNGQDGGSGGGTAGQGGTTAGTGVSGQGFDGRVASDNRGGGGGGAGGVYAGSPIDGVSGVVSSISGITRTYCVGGRGESADRGSAVSGSGGFGGMRLFPAFDGGTNGGPGQVILRYLGPQKGTGGVVTTDGDYVIHTFATTGTTTYTG